jgi:hypothetical protein
MILQVFSDPCVGNDQKTKYKPALFGSYRMRRHLNGAIPTTAEYVNSVFLMTFTRKLESQPVIIQCTQLLENKEPNISFQKCQIS